MTRTFGEAEAQRRAPMLFPLDTEAVGNEIPELI